MRSFFISAVLFLLLIGLIVGNAFYIHHISDQLSSQLETLTLESDASAVLEAEAYWEKHRPFVALSVSYRELDHVSDTLLSLRASYDAGDFIGFSLYRRLALEAIRDMVRPEQFSTENLL